MQTTSEFIGGSEPYAILIGDCLDRMREIPDGSIDAIVTDPPYGLAFMGAKWDSFGGSTGNQTTAERQEEGKRYADENKGAPRYANSHGKRVTKGEMVNFQESMTPVFEEALRVAKCGAHLLCFGGTRTFHRMACAIEDAGWEIRDTIMWVYGSGFPKSMDVGKAIDKALGAKRETIGVKGKSGSKRNCMAGDFAGGEYMTTEPATEQAREWDGWGTCLKPAWEPIIVARKPLDGTVAHNVMTYGTGAINIDGCRVGTETMVNRPAGNKVGGNSLNMSKYGMPQDAEPTTATGRFPANLVHDGSDEVLSCFPYSKGQQTRVIGTEPSRTGDNGIYGHYGWRNEFIPRDNGGSAARFFYCAKASKRDRGEGNDHPTVKPTALMQWLVRLVCPQCGLVMDPFCGSGSTGVACVREGMRFLGIEKDPHYAEIADHRISDEPYTVFAEI